MTRAFSDDLRSRVLAAAMECSAISGGQIWNWHFNGHRLDHQRTGGSIDACEAGPTRWLTARLSARPVRGR